jgi:hypothetical protein
MVPPRSPDFDRFLELAAAQPSASSGRPAAPWSGRTGGIGVLDADRLRAASMTAICMPKQMPKYGTRDASELRRADLAFRAALVKSAGHQMLLTCSRNGAGSSCSNTSLDPVEIDLHLLAIPCDSASINDGGVLMPVYLPTMAIVPPSGCAPAR